MKVSGSLPSIPVPPASKWKHVAGLKLADPEFNIPGPVDILFGADVFRKVNSSRVCQRNTRHSDGNGKSAGAGSDRTDGQRSAINFTGNTFSPLQLG